MASQISFYRKPYTDRTQPNVTAAASEASDIAIYALNRGNISAWVTTGSLDSNLTTWEVDWADERKVNSIFLILHNFKSFTVKYWNGSSYVAFSPAINETTNTASTNYYEVTEVSTKKIQITINGTMTPDSDKYMTQFIATKMLGQFEGWPIIKNPKVLKNIKSSRMLSGKVHVSENAGGFSCTLEAPHWRIEADLDLIELLYRRSESFLVWLSGGDETQFFAVPEGMRKQDIYLMKTVNEYSPEYLQGLYKAGRAVSISFEEVTF